MQIPIRLLSDLSYSLGIIGLAEYQERSEVAQWLGDETDSISDPRGELAELTERPLREPCRENEVLLPVSGAAGADEPSSNSEPRWMKFLVLKKWHFTISDVDCVPSVPHGHEDAKTQSWPKMNPYTGRVFSRMHHEDISQRLDRAEMRLLWRNEKFVERCRDTVIWYAEAFPTYRFSGARRGHLHFPRW